jgi:predicted CopG family antitoxin
LVKSLVRIISISDEVYFELSRIKNGASFTQLLKTLLSERTVKGDAKNILAFLKTQEVLSEESEKNITTLLKKTRKNAVARKFN